jgi:hypothetical protein
VFDDLMELQRHTQQLTDPPYPRHVNFMPCGPICLVFPIVFHKVSSGEQPQRGIGCTGKLFPACVGDHIQNCLDRI